MSELEQAIRDAFLRETYPRLDASGTSDVRMLRIVADGLVAALKKYDELALEVRKTGKPPR